MQFAFPKYLQVPIFNTQICTLSHMLQRITVLGVLRSSSFCLCFMFILSFLFSLFWSNSCLFIFWAYIFFLLVHVSLFSLSVFLVHPASDLLFFSLFLSNFGVDFFLSFLIFPSFKFTVNCTLLSFSHLLFFPGSLLYCFFFFFHDFGPVT